MLSQSNMIHFVLDSSLFCQPTSILVAVLDHELFNLGAGPLRHIHLEEGPSFVCLKLPRIGCILFSVLPLVVGSCFFWIIFAPLPRACSIVPLRIASTVVLLCLLGISLLVGLGPSELFLSLSRLRPAPDGSLATPKSLAILRSATPHAAAISTWVLSSGECLLAIPQLTIKKRGPVGPRLIPSESRFSLSAKGLLKQIFRLREVSSLPLVARVGVRSCHSRYLLQSL